MPKGLSRPTCSVEDCARAHKGHGYCEKHLYRHKRYGNPNIVRNRPFGSRKSKGQEHRILKYGLMPEDVQNMLVEQDYKCALCRQPLPDRFHVDHDHVTGIVRGLLHPKCNQGLGFFQDDPELCRAAAEYLETNKVSLASKGSFLLSSPA